MKWFGESWGSSPGHVCVEERHVDVPIGNPCSFCRVQFVEHDQGVILPTLSRSRDIAEARYHIKCFLRELGVKHD